MDQKPIPVIDYAAEQRQQAGLDYSHIVCPTCKHEFGASGVADAGSLVHCRQCGQPLQVTKKGA